MLIQDQLDYIKYCIFSGLICEFLGCLQDNITFKLMALFRPTLKTVAHLSVALLLLIKKVKQNTT